MPDAVCPQGHPIAPEIAVACEYPACEASVAYVPFCRLLAVQRERNELQQQLDRLHALWLEHQRADG